jgi:hypothetical protein
MITFIKIVCVIDVCVLLWWAFSIVNRELMK